MKIITTQRTRKRSVPTKPLSRRAVRESAQRLMLMKHSLRITLSISITVASMLLSTNVSRAETKAERLPYDHGNFGGLTTPGDSVVRLELNPVKSNAQVNATGPLIWGNALWRNLSGAALQSSGGLTQFSLKLPVQRFTLSGMPTEQIALLTEVIKTLPAVTMELTSTRIRHLKLQNYLLNGTASFQGKRESFSIPVIIRPLTTNRFSIEGKIDASDIFAKSNNFMLASIQGLAKFLLVYEKR